MEDSSLFCNLLILPFSIISATNMPNLAPIAAAGSMHMKVGVVPHHGSWHQLPSSDGDQLLDPSSDPGILLHGKFDTAPIDGVRGLYCTMAYNC